MARWHLALTAVAVAGATVLPAPAHAFCQAQIVNSPPTGAFSTCTDPAPTAYSMAVPTGSVWWYVYCNGSNTFLVPTQLAISPGGAWGAIPPGCGPVTIALRAGMVGTNAVAQLTP